MADASHHGCLRLGTSLPILSTTKSISTSERVDAYGLQGVHCGLRNRTAEDGRAAVAGAAAGVAGATDAGIATCGGAVGLALAGGALGVGAAAAVAIPAIAAGAVGFVGYKVYRKLKDRTDRGR